MNRPIRSIALLGVLAAALPAACTAQQSPTVAAAASQAVTPPTAAPIVTGLPDFTRLVERVGPAVVNISAEIAPAQRNPRSQMPPGFEEFFRQFGMPMPGMPDGPGGGGTSLGSGFIISDDGYVLTNHHVISGADKVTVTTSDRREFSAEVVGSDEQYDVALLKIDADNLRWLRAGQSSGLQPGQWVVAIGSPFGLDHSVTAGIVSAVGRSNPYAGQQGVSFAIPIDLAMNALEQIKETGEVRRGMLGVNIQPVSPDMARAMGLSDSRGAIVSNVQPGSAAEKAGIRRMDVIRAFNGTRINDASDLPPIVGAVAPGSKATVQVLRDGKEVSLDLVVGAESAQGGTAARGAQGGSGGAATAPAGTNALGITARDLDTATRQRLGIEAREGVLLEQVDPRVTRESGLRPGDVVLQVGRDSVASVADFNRALAGVKDGETVMLLVSRGGTTQFVAVTAPAG